MKYVRLISIVILLLSFCAQPGLVSARPQDDQDLSVTSQWQKDHLRFAITQVVLGDFISPATTGSMSTSQREEKELAVTFEFRNENQQRKIDLAAPFTFFLHDEFGNEYRQIPGETPLLDDAFPANTIFDSLYPGAVYRQTLFFESPVNASRTLTLSVDAHAAGITEPIFLGIARAQIRDLLPPIIKRSPTENDLLLVGPASGTEVLPGAVVHLSLRLPADVIQPNGVYIVLPNFVFEDPGPKFAYDIRIPKDQPQGPFVVVVMARWGERAETILSKSITLQVSERKITKQSNNNAPYLD